MMKWLLVLFGPVLFCVSVAPVRPMIPMFGHGRWPWAPMSGHGRWPWTPMFGHGRWPLLPMFGHGRWPQFHHSQPWWQGPNVCISRAGNVSFERGSGDVDDVVASMSTDCYDHYNHYRRCESRLTLSGETRTSGVIYECCYGYGRKEGEAGCPVEFDLEPLTTTLMNVGAKRFRDLVEVTGLRKTLRNGNNYTIFAPFDDVMEDVDLKLVNELAVDEVLEDWQTTVESHIVAGSLRTSNMKCEDVLTTLNNRTIRLGYYRYPNFGRKLIVTANCARVVKPNNFATNGIVHVIDGTMPLTTNSVAEIIENDPQFSILKAALIEAGMMSRLKEDTQLTLFAPTDGAFKTLEQKLSNTTIRNLDCLSALLENHVVPQTICSASITGTQSVNTLLHTLTVSRNADDKIFIKDAQLVAKDIMATNGVIHSIDSVLVPEEAMQLPYLVEGALLDLLEEADLLHLLQNTKNVTFFAPTEQAIKNLREDVKESSVLRQILLHHVVPEYLTTDDLGQDTDSKVTAMDSNDLRFDFCARPFSRCGRSRGLTINCVNVVKRDIIGCNIVVHRIDKVLIPPSGNILEILKADSNYSTLMRAIEISGLGELLDGDGALTLFAPNNDAFEALPEEYLERVMNDAHTLRNVISHHIVEDIKCSESLKPRWWCPLYLTTLVGDRIRVRESCCGLRADNATVIKPDTIAVNGVIHFVDKVLFPY